MIPRLWVTSRPCGSVRSVRGSNRGLPLLLFSLAMVLRAPV